ncbi:HupE/UreJ family protein [Pseudarthrobacter sp. SSS035]|uniref:HupE/UreJ family protein n=1 Tax=Pseudarthrobacter sp. SSS035 TaxID=2931399 RepID=UPI00200BA516|nr:HupE/UreJ family protein [Pseudarthrobacter sp. SSS035]
MRRLVMFLIAFVVLFGPATAAQAHPVGTTGVLIEVKEDRLGLTLQLQLDQLNKATGLDLVRDGSVPAGDIARLVNEKIAITAGDAAYTTEITGIGYGTINGSDALIVNVAAASPSRPGPFTLDYSLLTDKLSGHKVYVSRVVDGHEAELLGVITADQPTLAIDVDTEKASVGAMIGHGMHHIADGYDHLLFLAVLLLSAPLVAKRTAAGWRWSPRADSLRSSVKRILTIVTAFTLGHSITLLIVSLGWFTPPVQYVETIVAASIAVAAWNLVRPMFAHGEVVLASVFGLVHGMAFATTILEMNLDTPDTLLAVLGFNIGIELAQLLGVILTVPLIHVAATGNHYRRLCGVFAVFGIVASAAWVVGIWTDSDSALTPLFDGVAAYPLVSYLVFAGVMLLLGFAKPRTISKTGARPGVKTAA